jgi:hypothetical protein
MTWLFVGAVVATGTFWMDTALLLLPHPPQLESPCKHKVLFAVPVPNSPVGANPAIKSVFPASPKST